MSENDGGDCLEAAINFVAHTPEATVVHAIVSGEGALKGVRFLHAYNVLRGMAIDTSNGNSLCVPLALYEARAEVTPEERREYTKREVLENGLRTGHCGPWDDVFAGCE